MLIIDVNKVNLSLGSVFKAISNSVEILNSDNDKEVKGESMNSFTFALK